MIVDTSQAERAGIFARYGRLERAAPYPVLAVALATVILYAAMIGWGLPHATAADRIKTFAIDDVLPLGALAEMRSSFIEPGPNRNVNYPWLHYFLTAGAQAPYLVYLRATGKLAAPAADYPYGLADPVSALRGLTLAGRFLTVLMAAGIVIASWRFSSTLWGRRAGIIAALLTACNYLLFYYGRTGNPDVPAFFWTAWGLVVFASILKEGLTPKRAALLGALAGLALATKDQALLVFFPVGCLLLLESVGGIAAWRPRLRLFLLFAAAAAAAHVAGAGMLVDPARHIAHIRRLFSPEWHLIATAGGSWPTHPATLAGAAGLAAEFVERLADAMSWPVLVAVAAGVALAWRKSRRTLVLLTPFPMLVLLLTLPTGIVVLRYFLPLTLIAGSFAAAALASIPRPAVRSLLVVACLAVAIAYDAGLAYEQHHDPRGYAAEWFRERTLPGMRVHYFGAPESLPRLEAGVVSRQAPGSENWMESSRFAPRILERLGADGPDFVVVSPDWTSRPGMLHSAACPPEVFEALENGSLGYRLEARFEPKPLWSGIIRPPRLDYPHALPVRIYSRANMEISSNGAAAE
ncbi:MAG: glycosyltransferase family 39 protein [Bryobacteraceae bacterium]|nr:glycosyltransferase family 39 protein [Bryobacteraceae bacterium]